jgi:large subunit ribosomal protein L18
VYKTNVELKKKARARIRRRIRKKISGTSDKPRVIVNRSNRYLYIQVIDDTSGTVLASASTLEKDFKEKNKATKNKKASESLGKLAAQRIKKKKIKTIVFDRGAYPYHGRIKILADAMRKEGLKF